MSPHGRHAKRPQPAGACARHATPRRCVRVWSRRHAFNECGRGWCFSGFLQKLPTISHNLFLNDEQIAHLVRNQSSYELSFNGLESNKTHKWHITEAKNNIDGISQQDNQNSNNSASKAVAAGEFTVKSSNDAGKSEKNRQRLFGKVSKREKFQ